jgi:glutathione S-transferase
MIEVHHLNDSRSQRVLWLLEELGLEYELVKHERDPQTRLSPPSLLAVHPLGKAPLIRDGNQTVIESAAILEYIVRKYGKGQLAPAESSPDYPRYLQLMHYAEGSAMLPLMMTLYVRRLGDAGAPLLPRITSETNRHVGFLDAELGHRDYFVGSELTAADIQLSFVVQMARLFYKLDAWPNLARWIAACEARPAYRRSVERGGPYSFGR